MRGTTRRPRKRARAVTVLAAVGALIMAVGALGLMASPASAEHKDSHNPPGQANANANANSNDNQGKSASAPGHNKVGICHRTGSATNRYIYIEVPAAQANGHITGTSGQHNRQITWPEGATWQGQAMSGPVLDYLATGRADCEDSTPTTTDVCPDGTDNAGQEIPEGETAESFCEDAETLNLCPDGTDKAGQQIPEGQNETVFCAEVAGEEVLVKKPNKKPTVKGVEAVAPAAAAPTAVAAGAGGAPASPLQTIAQMLVAGGMLLLVAGAWIGLGRREPGTHEA